MSSASSTSSSPDVDIDDDCLRRLLNAQPDFAQLLPVVLVRHPNYPDDPSQSFASFCPIAARCRQDPVNWILRARSHYRLSPVTAHRAVNYLDRFLEIRRVYGDWGDRLLAAACLSLAAKMANDRFPRVSSLRRFVPGFLLTRPMLRRMELFVGSVLEWRLLSVTPFDYLPIFATTVAVSTPRDFVQTCSDLLLRSIYFPVFLNYGPSEQAVAAVLCASGVNIDFEESLETIAALIRDRAMGYGIDKGTVRACYQFMTRYFVPGARNNNPRQRSPSPEPELRLPLPNLYCSESPTAVLEAIDGIDAQTDSEAHVQDHLEAQSEAVAEADDEPDLYLYTLLYQSD